MGMRAEQIRLLNQTCEVEQCPLCSRNLFYEYWLRAMFESASVKTAIAPGDGMGLSMALLCTLLRCLCTRLNIPILNIVSTLYRGCDAQTWTRLLIRSSTVLVLHLSRFTVHARCYRAGTDYTNSDGRLSDVVSNVPQDFPLRSDGPTVNPHQTGFVPFKLDSLTIAILGETPVCQLPYVTERTSR